MRRASRWLVLIVLGCFAAGREVPSAQTPAYARVNVGPGGQQTTRSSAEGVISADGRFVAFASADAGLVADDTNNASDVFVRDRLLGRTARVSLAASGRQTSPDSFQGGSLHPSISDTGRFVAFYSEEPDLVPNDAMVSPDLFVRDRDVDADGLFDEPGQVDTVRVTVRSDGTPGVCNVSPLPICGPGQDPILFSFSGNGRHVLFWTKLVFDDSDSGISFDVYARDLLTQRTTRLTGPDGESVFATKHSMSQSGRIVALSAGPAPPGFEGAFVLDRDVSGNGIMDEPGDTSSTRVPTPPGQGPAFSSAQAISADGTLVAFARDNGSGTVDLWIWHRLGNVARQIATFGTPVQNVQFSSDNRRISYLAMPMSGRVHRITTFDADGDGHLDPRGSFTSVDIPPFPGVFGELLDATLRYVVFFSGDATLVPGDTNGVEDIFVHDRGSPAPDTFDTDADGLSNEFEGRFGLNGSSASGAEGAAGDPDGDGRTNAQEQDAGTHPRGFFTRYLAEGATGAFFSTRLSVANPGGVAASVLLRYQTDTGHTTSTPLLVPPLSRRHVNIGSLPSLGSASFSTVIESDREVVADRSMFWTSALYGSHAETSVSSPAVAWYVAEGATHGNFDLFYLVQNPSAVDTAQLEVRFLLTAGQPVVRTYTVRPATRLSIYVDQIPGLEAKDVSAVLTSTNNVPVILERAMYYSRPDQPFAAGHASAGVTAPATTWFLAEGATGAFFDLFVLLANPGSTPADVEIRYLRPAGPPIVRTRTLAPDSRTTIYVAAEDPALADTPVSTIITSTNAVPIVAERAMWWPAGAGRWHEAHNSFGATQTAVRWGFADGESGAPPVNTQTYLLVANGNSLPATVRVTLLFDDGPSAPREYVVAASSRFNVPVAQEFPSSAGRGFGAIVESIGASPIPIVVERAMYSDADGVVWAAGTNVLGTPLP